MNDWDVAYAQTEEREVINPRPLDEAQIFRVLQPYADAGFLTYSEGCNDDVNKAVWSALGWNPEADVTAACCVITAATSSVRTWPTTSRRGCCALERNWRGAAAGQRRGGRDAGAVSGNGAQRDAAAEAELALPAGALSRLLRRLPARPAARTKPHASAAPMERLRARRPDRRCRPWRRRRRNSPSIPSRARARALRARVFELAEALFQSVRMQLSVPRYAAIDPGRGANLDLIDRPITNADWLRAALRRNPRAAQRSRPQSRDRRDCELDQSRAGRIL